MIASGISVVHCVDKGPNSGQISRKSYPRRQASARNSLLLRRSQRPIAGRFNLRYDRGNVVGTPRQRFLLTGTYQLPYGPGRRWTGGGKFLNAVFGSWDASTITQLQTGQWLSPTMNAAADQSNIHLNNERYLGGAVARPDCMGKTRRCRKDSAGIARANWRSA